MKLVNVTVKSNVPELIKKYITTHGFKISDKLLFIIRGANEEIPENKGDNISRRASESIFTFVVKFLPFGRAAFQNEENKENPIYVKYIGPKYKTPKYVEYDAFFSENNVGDSINFEKCYANFIESNARDNKNTKFTNISIQILLERKESQKRALQLILNSFNLRNSYFDTNDSVIMGSLKSIVNRMYSYPVIYNEENILGNDVNSLSAPSLLWIKVILNSLIATRDIHGIYSANYSFINIRNLFSANLIKLQSCVVIIQNSDLTERWCMCITKKYTYSTIRPKDEDLWDMLDYTYISPSLLRDNKNNNARVNFYSYNTQSLIGHFEDYFNKNIPNTNKPSLNGVILYKTIE